MTNSISFSGDQIGAWKTDVILLQNILLADYKKVNIILIHSYSLVEVIAARKNSQVYWLEPVVTTEVESGYSSSSSIFFDRSSNTSVMPSRKIRKL